MFCKVPNSWIFCVIFIFLSILNVRSVKKEDGQLLSCLPSSVPVNESIVATIETIRFAEPYEEFSQFWLQILDEEAKISLVPAKIIRGAEPVIGYEIILPPFKNAGYAFVGSNISTNVLALKVFDPPKITSISPNSTTATGKDLIYLGGINFFPSSEAVVFLDLHSSDARNISVPASFENGSYYFEFPLIPELCSFSQDVQPVKVRVLLSLNGVRGAGNTEVTLTVLPKHPVKIGYIMEGFTTTSEAAFQMNLARTTIDTIYQRFVISDFRQGVDDMDVAEAVLDYCREHYDLVVLRAKGFETALGNISHSLLCNSTQSSGSYHATKGLIFDLQLPLQRIASVSSRWYEARYLHGLIAGFLFKQHDISGKVGYLAAYPSPASLRNINAFVLGCREIYSSCRVKVVWLYTWHDEDKERSAALRFWVEENVRVLVQDTEGIESLRLFSNGLSATTLEDLLYNQQSYLDADIDLTQLDETSTGYSFGPVGDLRQLVGKSVLSGMKPNWQSVLNRMVYDLLNEDWTSFGKFSWSRAESPEDMLPEFSSVLDATTQTFIIEKASALWSGELSLFCGPLTTTTGDDVATEYPSEIIPQALSSASFDESLAMYSRSTGSFCNSSSLLDDGCCLSDSPGLSEMYFLLQGVDVTPACTDYSSCPLGLIKSIEGPYGMLFARYESLQEVEINLVTLCDDQGVSPEEQSVSLEFAVQGSVVPEIFVIEWDQSPMFNTTERDCENGLWCKLALASELLIQECQQLEENERFCFTTTVDNLSEDTKYYFRVDSKPTHLNLIEATSSSCITLPSGTLIFFPMGLQIGLSVVPSLLTLINATIFYLLWRNRKHPDMKQWGDNAYWIWLLSGNFGFTFLSFIALNAPRTNLFCNSVYAIGGISLTSMLSPLIVRAEEISLKELKQKKASNPAKDILWYNCLNAVLLTLAAVLNPSEVVEYELSYYDNAYLKACASARTYGTVPFFALAVQIYAIFIIFLVFYRLYKIRRAKTKFNHSKRIAAFLCGFLVSELLILPLRFSYMHPSVNISLVTLRITVVVTLNMAIFLVPLLASIGNEYDNRITFLQSMGFALKDKNDEVPERRRSSCSSSAIQGSNTSSQQRRVLLKQATQVHPEINFEQKNSPANNDYGNMIEKMAELQEELDTYYDEYDALKSHYNHFREKLKSSGVNDEIRKRFPSWHSDMVSEDESEDEFNKPGASKRKMKQAQSVDMLTVKLPTNREGMPETEKLKFKE